MFLIAKRDIANSIARNVTHKESCEWHNFRVARNYASLKCVKRLNNIFFIRLNVLALLANIGIFYKSLITKIRILRNYNKYKCER